MKLEEAVINFKSYLISQQCVSPHTLDAYSTDLKQFLDYLNGVVIWCGQITTDHIKGFLHQLQTEEISARSRSRKISCLRKFFDFVVQKEVIKNPMKSVFLPKLEKKLPQFLTETETEQLLKTASCAKNPTEERNKVMLYLLYVCGLRISELVHLKTSQLDFSAGFLRVTGKGSKERVIPLTQEIILLLKNYLEQTYPTLSGAHQDTKAVDILFPVYYGKKLKPLTRQSFWLYLKKLAIIAGIHKDISPHQLRHSLATHLLKNGADLRSLQLLLGHEQLDTVQIYTHIETSHLRKIYDDKHPRS